MTNPIEIEIKGADKIVAALTKFPQEIAQNFRKAGEEAEEEIVETRGLKNYPPKTEANAPGRYSIKTHQKMGYYVRGTGAFSPSGKQTGGSEDYGSNFYAKHTPGGTIIGNRTSYAKYLADENLQARVMEKYGWRKLIDVAKEKLGIITTIFNKWAQYTIDKLGL